MAFTPYLFFSGNCAEAFEFYRKIFDGDLSITRNSDVPADAQMPGAGDFVMHASLTVADGTLLLGSDDPTGDDGAKTGFSVSYTAASLESARLIHTALAKGGEVTMEVTEMFWSPGFGMCVDQFGVPWMIDVAHAEQ